ncbi:excinuclease ABC subunit UvrA [Gammaproteobacteria bacterium]|nr:excinuclease ABC subunit UvrA [Gammaproteobacteria bacterium]
MNQISVRGGRTHNLKNIDLDIPREQFVVITGLSGSGKSSLAFDTLYAEGQRRYVESLSAYARQFLSVMEKPDVDQIEGLSPAISIEQKSTSHNPRSTVGTITEIYDYLRLLFARAGEPRCPDHNTELKAQTISQMVDQLIENYDQQSIMILSPIITDRKGEHLHIFQNLQANGFIRARIDGILTDLDSPPKLDKNKKHKVEAVIDRLRVKRDSSQRLAESLETCLSLSEGVALIQLTDSKKNLDLVFSSKYSCTKCGYSLPEMEPRSFSFNNPAGACVKCDGLGVTQFFDPDLIIENTELSIAEGAIRGWDRRNVYYFHLISSLAQHYKFDVETPHRKLTKKVRDLLLHGSGEERIDFSYTNDRGDKITRKHRFEGVLPNMERRYQETESSLVRDNLQKFVRKASCPDCSGSRLKREYRNVFIAGKTLPSLTEMPIDESLNYLKKLNLTGQQGQIAKKILKEIIARLQFLVDVGLNYLTLNRSSETLSGGEAQRIRLASQIGAGLVGVIYILDEPSIGLHQRDNERLLNSLNNLKKLGNTVIVVEHDEEAIRAADFIIDMGPGAGVHGGEVVAFGDLSNITNNEKSITGKYLSGKKSISVPKARQKFNPNKIIKIKGASGNNLANVDAEIPIGLMSCVTGVSGSGKSTLINQTLYPVASKKLNRSSSINSAPHLSIEGLNHLDKVVDIDQSPIGRTPRSNPATYTGLFTPIRELFAQVEEARARGYNPGRFSFNVKGGRCEACQGDGLIKVEMHFLPDIYVTCDLCAAKRYNRETLDITYKGKNISEVLDMTVEDAHSFFQAIPMIERKLSTLLDVGLSYIKLGQSATTLSGGEAQRIKLSRELSKRDTGSTLYILDEPTTGLHFEDISQLLKVLHRLRDDGNTVVVIEHNLDVIKTCDWVIDLGPEGGSGGGKIIAAGPPEDIAKSKKSHTGVFLKKIFLN